MKLVKTVIATTIASAVLLAGTAQSQNIQGEDAELSYKMGHDIGQRMLEMGIKSLDPAAFSAGAVDAMAKRDSRLTADQATAAQETLTRLQTEEQDRRRQELANAAQNNLKAGEDYLTENAKREGVQVTNTGLQYEVVRAGDGPKPKRLAVL